METTQISVICDFHGCEVDDVVLLFCAEVSPEDGDPMFLRNEGHLPTSLHGAKTQKNHQLKYHSKYDFENGYHDKYLADPSVCPV
jgi:hypothetical protein